MAAALQSLTISKSKFHNWIKAALALLITKQEIEPVVYDEIEHFQQKCLQDIATINGLPAGSTCSSCCTENVIVCPTNGICKVKHGKCKYHKNNATKYRRSGCPNNICHNLKSEIEKAHRYHGPSFKNTDATKWCGNPWEIAKCYMPPDGYKNIRSAEETDFNGIISVIMNHRGFEAKITDNLSQPGNIFEQGREVGKDIRHSPDLEVDDTRLTHYITILNNILNDPGLKGSSTIQHSASQKLRQLHNDDLVIGKDVVIKVLDDAGKVVMEKLKNEVDQYRKKLLEITQQAVKDINDQEHVSLTQLSEALQSSVDTLEAKTRQMIKKIDSKAEQVKQSLDDSVREGIWRVNKERESALIQIQERIKDKSERGIHRRISVFERFCCISGREDESVAIYKEEANTCTPLLEKLTSELDYQLLKEYLKDDLIEFYYGKNSTIPLSPLFEHKDTPMVDFYMRPDMKVVPVAMSKENITLMESKQNDVATGEEIVTSLSDIFQTELRRKCEVYLTADAGFGKTSFSKYLALSWSQAHTEDKKERVGEMSTEKAVKKAFRKNKHRGSEEADKACMRGYDFLFLVFLRDSCDMCSTDELIFKQISKLPRYNHFNKDFILKILYEEKCLVILDGLDEWTHPDDKCSEKVQIPHRIVRKKCSVLTTTRPWKFGLLSLTSNEIDKQIELVGLTDRSAQTLEKRAIARITKHHSYKAEKQMKSFRTKIEENKLEDLEKVPLLLMYLICLWFENKELGSSRCAVYCRIIELLLSRTLKNCQKLVPDLDIFQCELPECIIKQESCKKFSFLIMALAELAYYSLFNEKRENTLVFDKAVAEKYLTSDNMDFIFKSGILTGSTTVTLTSETSKVSFCHKTVQEFFAALFISCQSDAQKSIKEKCRSVQEILDFSKIFEFIGGMNSNIMSSLSNDWIPVVNNDEETRKYRTRTGWETLDENPLYNIQNILLSCLSEAPESENLILYVQDLFITEMDKQNTHLQYLSKLNKDKIKSVYIDMGDSPSSLREIIDLFSLKDLESTQKLYFAGDINGVEVILESFPWLQSLSLSSSIEEYYEGNLSENIRMMTHLQRLDIFGITLSHKDLELAFDVISSNTSLKEIDLRRLSCSIHGFDCPRINFDLANHSSLSKVVLIRLPPLQLNVTTPSLIDVALLQINIGESSMLLSPEMTKIKHVRLESLKMAALSFREFVEILQNLPQSVKVNIGRCVIEPETKYERVVNNIRRTKSFNVILDLPLMFTFEKLKPSEEHNNSLSTN